MQNRKGIIGAILSLSFVTVMASTAVSPALSEIASNFSTVNPMLIKMILTVPAIFIILTNLVFKFISNLLGTKPIALLGLLFYIVGGAFGGLTNNIYVLLLFRAVLGIGVGLVTPLATGLFPYYFEEEEQGKLIGYAAAMNNLGAIIAMILSGYLVSINWRYSFLAYLLGIGSFIAVLMYLPDTKMKASENKFTMNSILKDKFYYSAMFLTMIIFYIFITDFSMISAKEHLFEAKHTGIFMSVLTVVAFLAGMLYDRIERMFKTATIYLATSSFLVGYIVLATKSSLMMIITALSLLGFALGVIIPYLNAELLSRLPKSEATSAMAIMSAVMYLGQFVSPLMSQVLRDVLGIEMIRFPYFFGIVISAILLISLFFNKDRRAII